jgi:activating signal cointegrator 1
VKALTISQPYATLITHRVKLVENRTWSTKHRGRLAIHAGKGTQYMSAAEAVVKGYPTGAVIGYCDLIGCIHIDDLDSNDDSPVPDSVARYTHAMLADHEYTEGPWCWILECGMWVDPVVASGKLGLWDWEANDG